MNTKNTSELIANNRQYVEAVAKQYLNRGLTMEQLIDEGNKGLLKAAERYDESKGYAFISYAVWWVRQSILQALADKAEGVEGNQLTEREQFILQHTDEEAAVHYEITPQRVQQIRERALNKQMKKREELLEHACKLKCIQKDKEVIGDMCYGSYPDLDRMVDSDNVKHRIRIASLGYGLDKLKDDADPEVRLAVAKTGHYLVHFKKDSSPLVRQIAKNVLGEE